MCFMKKVFLEILQNFGKHLGQVLFYNKVADLGLGLQLY